MREDARRSVRAQFSRTAGNYAKSGVHSRGPNLDAMLAEARLRGRERVLDVGCGPGHTAFAFAPKARDVVALDLSPQMLEAGRGLAAARGIANVRFEQGDVEHLPFAAGAFDLVTSRFSAHHYPDPPRALAEIARVLHRGGQLLLVDSFAPNDDALDAFLDAIERARDPSHVRNWRIAEWIDMMRCAGFQASLLETWSMPLDFSDWIARMETPPAAVAELKTLMTNAPASVRERYALRANGDWSIPVALLRASSCS